MGWVEKPEAAVVDGDQSTEPSKIALRTPLFCALSNAAQTFSSRRGNRLPSSLSVNRSVRPVSVGGRAADQYYSRRGTLRGELGIDGLLTG